MTISVRTRQDVVVVDPERFLATAREAFRELYPDIPEADVAEHVRDVPDAVFVLLERFGELAGEAPDGLSSAGELKRVVFDDPLQLKDYGCFLPADPFALPPDTSERP